MLGVGPGKHDAPSGQDTALRRSPGGIIHGRVTRFCAELHEQGLNVSDIKPVRTADGPYTLVEILPAADTDTTLHELLCRHGLTPIGIRFSAQAEPVLEQHVRLGALSEVDAERRIAGAAEECRAHGIETIAHTVTYLTDVGVLRLRLSPSSGLGLGNVALLAAAARRHDLFVRVSEIERWTTGKKSLSVELSGADNTYWRSQMPFPPGFLALRLAAVAARLSIDVTRISCLPGSEIEASFFLDKDTQLQGWGYELVIGTANPFGSHETRKFPLVLTVSPQGWHVWSPRCPPILLDVGLAAGAEDIVTAAFDAAAKPPPRHPMGYKSKNFSGGGWATIAEAAAVASVVVPFVQAMSAKGGSDFYNLLCTAVRRVIRRSEAIGEVEASPSSDAEPDRADEAEPDRTDLVAIVDPETNTELIAPAPLPEAAVLQLLRLNPHDVTGCILIWDGYEQTWHPVRRPRRP